MSKLDTLRLPVETSYYNDFDLVGCTGRLTWNGTYAVNKYSKGCVSNSTGAYAGIVPALFTSSLGSSLHNMYYELKSRGFGTTYEVFEENGSDAALGWFQLFDRNPQTPSQKKSRYKLAEENETGNILYSKIVHQISDPLSTVAESRKFCIDKEIWSLVSLVTPFIKFYLYPHVKILSMESADCVLLLMYHWWSWNRILQKFSDYTFLMENMEFLPICESSFNGFPDLVEKCKKDKLHTEYPPPLAKSKFSEDLSAEDLYQVDCELANRVFYAAIEYGYTTYDTVLRKCGVPEDNTEHNFHSSRWKNFISLSSA